MIRECRYCFQFTSSQITFPKISFQGVNGYDFHQACQSRGICLILSELRPQPMATLEEWRSATVFGQKNICCDFEQTVASARDVARAFRIGSSKP